MATIERIAFRIEINNPNSTNRFSDGRADIKGRFYGGIYPADACVNFNQVSTGFYRYSKNRGLEVALNIAKASTGFTWNYKTNSFYYTDACRGLIKKFKWSRKSGKFLCKKRALKTLKLR